MNKKKDLMAAAFKCDELARRYSKKWKIEYKDMLPLVHSIHNELQDIVIVIHRSSQPLVTSDMIKHIENTIPPLDFY